MSFWQRLFGSGQTPASPPASHLPDLAFPFPLVKVAGREAVAAWRKHQAQWRAEGCSAVVLGDAEDVRDRTAAMSHEDSTPAAILARAATLSAADYFARRSAEFADDELDLETGPWPTERVPPSPLTAHTDIGTGVPKLAVYLAKIPTRHPWEIAAHLKFGGWNDCPSPEEQAVILKHWNEKYGAEIYAMTGDVMECLVSKPPATQAAALALAREQFLFCSDIVHQGVQSIEVLAATLLRSETWYFWWD